MRTHAQGRRPPEAAKGHGERGGAAAAAAAAAATRTARVASHAVASPRCSLSHWHMLIQLLASLAGLSMGCPTSG